MVEPVPVNIPKPSKRLPFRKPDGSIGETTHASNLMCPNHMATNPTYRDGYDEIVWDDMKVDNPFARSNP